MTSLPPRADPSAAAEHALAAGRAAFNRGQFFAAHESWEEAWRVAAGAARTAMQGLIQIAAGLHHLHHDRAGPAARLVDKGVRKLQLASPGLAPQRWTGRDVARPEPLADLLAELDLDTFAVAIARLMDGCRARTHALAAPMSPSTVVVPRL
jgi:hypothetical protein